MKKTALFLLCMILFQSSISGQAPEKFQYQIVVRDGNGDLVINTPLTIEINILDAQQTSEYEETHSVTTTDQGLVLLVIGDGTTSDDFSDITWADGSHFMSVAIDDGSGSGFVQYSTSELLSVPYALVANSVSSNNTVSILDYGATPFFEWSTSNDNTSDDSAAIQQAVDENPGKRILFPSGAYNTSTQININESVELVGDGNGVTVVSPDGVSGFVIKADWVTVKDMFLFGKSTANIGLNLRDVHYTTIENVAIRDFEIGIELYNSHNTKIDKVDTFYGGSGAKIKDGVRVRGNSVNNHIMTSHISATDYAVNIIHTGADLEGLTIGDTFLRGNKSGIRSTGILSLNVANCIIDLSDNGYSINVSNSSGMLLSNNWISDAQNGNMIKAIRIVNSNDVHISNNNIKNRLAPRSIELINVSYSSIIGNTIEMLNQSGDQIFLGSGSTNNIIKDNVIRSPNPANGLIVDHSGSGSDHIIKDNRLVTTPSN